MGKKILFSILAEHICGLDRSMPQTLSSDQLEQICKLSFAHDLAHIPGDYLSRWKDLPQCEALDNMKKHAMAAVYRHARLSYEYQRTCEALEQAKLPFLPLKGAQMRQYYPQEWMRTSCDVDILVHPEDLEAAADTLVKVCGYTRGDKGNHEMTMLAPGGLHVELHYTAIDEARVPNAQTVLKDFWIHARPVREGSYHHVLSDEMFYFFHIAHMAKHLGNGGCGIRTFLDLWLLDHKVEHDEQKRQALLEKGGMLAFARAASKLSRIWLEGEPMDPMSETFAEMILRGGTYGSEGNYVVLHSARKRSKLDYILSRVFLPYNRIKYQYPILQKHKWLTPLYQVVRWIRIVFKHRRRALYELKTNAELSVSRQEKILQLLDYLGL